MWRRYKLGDWAFSEPKKPKFVSILPTEDVRISVLAAMGMQNPVSAQLQEVIEKAKERVRIQMMGDLFEEEMDELLEEMDKMPVDKLEEFEKYVREEISKVDLGYVQYGSLQATLRLLKKFKDKEDLEENKQEIVEAFEYAKQDFISTFNSAIKALEEAESVNEIMVAKKELLLNLIEELPLGGDTCIFCEMYDDRCSLCDYAHKYGHRVCNSKNSSWATIQDAQDTLKNVIEREYWSEEE